MRFLGADGQCRPLGHLKGEPHHGLVDRADLLYVQGPVGEAFPIQQKELGQHPVDDAIGNQGHLDAPVRFAGTAFRAALQEGEPVGLEQMAMTSGEVKAAMVRPVIDQTEQGKQTRPGP